MKRVILSIIILALLPIIISQEITPVYPPQVKVGEEFDMTLNLNNFPKDVYDVKIEILNQSTRIAKTFWNSEWKSSIYWINDFINTSKKETETFKINITEPYQGENTILFKIRNSSDNVKEFPDYPININYEATLQEEPDETLQSSWEEDDIINGKSFEIEVSATNLKNKSYDLKIWISIEENETVISERYDENARAWSSGSYYVNGFFEGPGNQTNEIKLRIKENYDDFKGNAKLYYRLRDKTKYEETIKIKEKETTAPIVQKIETKKQEPITNEVIQLSSNSNISNEEAEDIKTNDNLLYESQTEKIKKYSIASFAFFCVIFTILITWNKLD